MHTKPMAESEGTFTFQSAPNLYKCRKCGQQTASCRLWESSCGGYEDEKFECQNPDCRFVWWVEGIDS